ncbi:hypothetical protein HN018_06175 [Lichenicola cladoniae]|uniref:Uncharacterized protein n=1 Tax=Lichenicola cladoniae TaxID=1484109 RepID=A0A6M8HMS8_9PROT|nr:hypothetical protein [Lichenicola cladoniae]NPD67158.1 hypothetical protein [Acetobacteraceae bacterium]QKE89684.1 hypothetical protein HN018_06175 [Lichenicola cladoniae]
MDGTTRTEPLAGQPPDGRSRSRVIARRRSAVMFLRIGIWSVLHFVFYFLQQLAELLAPLLLVAGVGWWALPRIVGAITTQTAGPGATDSQAHDILNTISGTIPASVHIGTHWITAGGLITGGLLLMAIAAIGATLSALAAREM